jgi:hypothetical protein
MLPYINSNDGITVLVNSVPVHVSSDHNLYQQILTAVLNGENDEVVTELVETTRKKVEENCKMIAGLEYDTGIVMHNGVELHGYAVDKLVSMIENGHDATPLAKFLTKLQLNQSKQTIDDLYSFLEHGKIPLNADGNFLVYKAVRDDYMDIHSGKFDNHPGNTLEMPRNKVDDRREHTCSHGFHVCSYDYLPHFAQGSRVVICEVNPADVVSIPSDYNNTKMRVCKYKVIGEIEYKQSDNCNVLANMEVWDESYEVWDNDELLGTFDTIDEADEFAEDEIKARYDNELKIRTSSGILIRTWG